MLEVVLILLSASTCISRRADYFLTFKIIKLNIFKKKMEEEEDLLLLNIYMANSQ